MSGLIVFGWVFASHQIGAAIAAAGAGSSATTSGPTAAGPRRRRPLFRGRRHVDVHHETARQRRHPLADGI